MVHFKKITFALLSVLLLTSCATKNVSYFQDVNSEKTLQMAAAKEIALQPGDKISIVVNSKDPALAAIVNLPIVSQRAGYAGDVYSAGTQQQVSAYTLNSEGCIDFPQIGELYLRGLNREGVAALVKKRLIEANLILDPTVTVEYMNLHISVLGEVRTPGQYAISKDKVTILDAISRAGDLTIYGERENVRLLRTVGDTQQTYIINLTSDSAVVSSPAYYLQQNDIIYVTPNDKKSRESTVNGNNILSTGFWISVASLLASVTSIAIQASK